MKQTAAAAAAAASNTKCHANGLLSDIGGEGFGS